MPRHCSAGGCKCRDNRETRNAGITFHKLPKEAKRRKLWITNSRRADSWVPQTNFVYFCSKHFSPQSFELTGCSGIRRLKEDAVPTLFESSSTIKCKRNNASLRRQEDRKNPLSGNQENLEQKTGQIVEEARGQRSVAAPQQTDDENKVALPGEKVSSQGERQSPSPEQEQPRPTSPSRYMRRLPPPPGFYLSKEHSYAQLCPLLWKRRYDQVIGCLEKALRQLHAARRRETRLRSTVMRLRDKQTRQAALLLAPPPPSEDGRKPESCRRWTPTGEEEEEEGRGGGGCKLEESEAEDRFVGRVKFGGRLLSQEEKLSCFTVEGGEQEQTGGRERTLGGATELIRDNVQVTCRVSKTGRKGQTAMQNSETHRSPKKTSSGGTVKTSKDIKRVCLDKAPGKSLETVDSDKTDSQLLLQIQGPHRWVPAAVSLPDVSEQCGERPERLLLSETCEGKTVAKAPEPHGDPEQQHQLFWMQDLAEGQVILVPVTTEYTLQDGGSHMLKIGHATHEPHTLLASEVDHTGGVLGHSRTNESSGSVSTVGTACDGEQHNSVISAASLEMREDMREKLKEHLEGFHLQLSTEFLS